MKKIPNPQEYEVCVFDGVNSSMVYAGGLDCLVQWNNRLVWREDEELGEMCYKPYKMLTLDEIKNQMPNVFIITVIVVSPLSGEIIQYGNYGDEWWQVGDLDGYA